MNFCRSKEEKCTKAQSCTSGLCTWNQHIIFFDIDTIDNIILWIKLINLEHNQEILGEIKFNKLNLNNKPEWYNLNSSINRVLPLITNNRKRQLPDIPTAQLHANREKGITNFYFLFNRVFFFLCLVSQDLFQKATELKLRLHMQSKNEKSLITQRSFDQTSSGYEDRNARKSMVNLSSAKGLSTINLKEKARIPIIRDKSAPNSTVARRTTMIEQSGIDIEKTKLKNFEDKYRKTIKKRRKI